MTANPGDLLALVFMLGSIAFAVVVVIGLAFRAAIAHGGRNLDRIVADWEAQRDAAPADSTYLDPHRGPGPVLVSPDEGNWRHYGVSDL